MILARFAYDSVNVREHYTTTLEEFTNGSAELRNALIFFMDKLRNMDEATKRAKRSLPLLGKQPPSLVEKLTNMPVFAFKPLTTMVKL